MPCSCFTTILAGAKNAPLPVKTENRFSGNNPDEDIYRFFHLIFFKNRFHLNLPVFRSTDFQINPAFPTIYSSGASPQ